MKIAIYQVNLDRDTDGVAFESYDRLTQLQKTSDIISEIYDKVYETDFDGASLEDVYRTFNTDVPKDNTGRSLSVSDIVEVKDSGSLESGFFYCDSIGFHKVDFDSSKAGTMKNSRMKVLIVEPGKSPYVKEIDSGLKSLQHEVGGLIQAIYPSEEDMIAYVMNEEGKLMGLPPNRGLFGEDGEMYDIIVGTFMVVGLDEESFGSLSDALIQKYAELFHYPEVFFRINGHLQCIRIEESGA